MGATEKSTRNERFIMILQVGVKALIKNDKGQYLFLRRSERMEAETEPHWDIPGGRIDPTERLEQALAREIAEETNLTLSGVPQLIAAQDILVPAKDLHVVRLTYVANAHGEIAVSDEHQEYAWMTQDEALASHLDPYIREVFGQKLDNIV